MNVFLEDMLCFGHKLLETCWMKCSGFFKVEIKLGDRKPQKPSKTITSYFILFYYCFCVFVCVLFMAKSVCNRQER